MPLLERSQSSSREGDTQLKIGVVTYFDENIKDYYRSIAANMGRFPEALQLHGLVSQDGSNYEQTTLVGTAFKYTLMTRRLRTQMSTVAQVSRRLQ